MGFQETPKATHENYKQAIATYNDYSDKIFKPEFIEDIQITDKQTKKVSKFTSLKPLEQRVFILVFAQEIGQQAKRLQDAWLNEIKKFDDKDYTSENPKVAKKEDVLKYSNELLEVRKKFSSLFEKYVIKFIADFQNEITEDEKKIILKKVKEFHDLNKLVDRKIGRAHV